MILLKKRIQINIPFTCFFLLLSASGFTQEVTEMELKLKERQLRHKNIQNTLKSTDSTILNTSFSNSTNISEKNAEGIDSITMIHFLSEEINQLINSDIRFKDLVDSFVKDHETKIKYLCPTIPFETLYHQNDEKVYKWLKETPKELEGYFQILNATISHIQNNNL